MKKAKSKSKFLKLNSRDFWRGAINAGLTTLFTSLTTALATMEKFTDFNWQAIALAGLSGLFGYLTMNLFTNSQGIMKKEN